MRAALMRFWADDRGLSVFSILLVFVVFVVPPLVDDGGGRGWAGDVAYALLLLSGVVALRARGAVRGALFAIVVLAVVLDFATWVVPVGPAWVLGTSLVSLLIFVAVVLAHTLRAGPINFHRVQGAVAAYLLLGMTWAHAYALLAILRPGAFSGPVNAAGGARAWFYFSFVTLATLGYGDVLPVHPIARSLATLEAVTGSMYLAILVARLVSLAVAPGAAPPAGSARD